MRKFIGFLALPVVLMIVACSDNKPAEVKKEIIVVPSTPTIIVKDPPEKNTTVILDKNGVQVVTKKINVVVKPKKD